MKTFTRLVLLLATLCFAHIAAQASPGCPPQPPWTQPSIPDGASASTEQMVKAQLDVEAYVRGIEHWNNCNRYISGLQSGRMLLRAQEVADAYNAELRRFRTQFADTKLPR